MNAAEFQSVSRRLFRFLEEEYGFRVVGVAEEEALPEDLRGYQIQYQGETMVMVIRLDPVLQVPTIHNRRLYQDRLMPLLEPRSVASISSGKSGVPEVPESPEIVLNRYAEALRNVSNAHRWSPTAFVNAGEFQSSTRELFGYLETEFGFHEIEPSDESFLPEHYKGYEVRYRNLTTEICVSLEVYEQSPIVHIIRLGPDREVRSLGLLILARAPLLDPMASEHGFPLKQPAGVLLQKYAELLKSLGEDVLRGDFKSFPRLGEIGDELHQKRMQRYSTGVKDG